MEGREWEREHSKAGADLMVVFYQECGSCEMVVTEERRREMRRTRRSEKRGHTQADHRRRQPPGGQHRRARGAGGSSPSAAVQELQSRLALAPTRKIPLAGPGSPVTLRVLDLLCPVGFGQRALILAPPRTGKPPGLKDFCQGVTAGAPAAVLYCLLVGERPEEVTDFRRSVTAAVFASATDRPCEEQLAVAATCLERAVAANLSWMPRTK